MPKKIVLAKSDGESKSNVSFGLVIDFTTAPETYSFTGPWSGHHMKRVLSHITKAYLLYQRSIRRNVANAPISTDTLQLEESHV